MAPSPLLPHLAPRAPFLILKAPSSVPGGRPTSCAGRLTDHSHDHLEPAPVRVAAHSSSASEVSALCTANSFRHGQAERSYFERDQSSGVRLSIGLCGTAPRSLLLISEIAYGA